MGGFSGQKYIIKLELSILKNDGRGSMKNKDKKCVRLVVSAGRYVKN